MAVVRLQITRRRISGSHATHTYILQLECTQCRRRSVSGLLGLTIPHAIPVRWIPAFRSLSRSGACCTEASTNPEAGPPGWRAGPCRTWTRPAKRHARVTNFSRLVPLEASETRRVLDDIRVRCIIVAAHNRKQTSNRHFT